jgi:probable addiction module antidote protein
MSTVFVGGSRHITRLSAQAMERLNNIIGSGFPVIVGDAAGADKAVQKYLLEASYTRVTVFCSGDRPRNNLGAWETCKVATPKHVKGFQFFAAKDREMAKKSDFGLMIWDGKSAGTALNVLRLVRAGKKAVLLNVPDKLAVTFKTAHDWGAFLAGCHPGLIEDLRSRATTEEWLPIETPSPACPLGALEPAPLEARPPLPLGQTDDELAAEINAALASGDLAAVVEALGNIAKARGMSQVAKEAGLARESLYRSLNSAGNPEFSTVMKVMASVGLRLSVVKTAGR